MIAMILVIGPKWISARWRLRATLLTSCLLLSGVAGCSLGVMAGKAMFGDPKMPSAFYTRTGVDLTKEDKTLLVLVQTPQAVDGELPSLELDLIDGISRRMKLHGVKVVDPDRVAKWIDENGGRFDHPTELARQFDTDYIAVIDVETFQCHDPSSPNLYQGLATGQMQVFQVQGEGESKQAQQVFGENFRNQYPPHGPVPVDQLSPKMFQKRFLDSLSDRIGSRFYAYRLGDEM